MASQNLFEYLKSRSKKSFFEQEETNPQIIENIQRIFKLTKKPTRIECYDISHLGGTNTVGSMVVWQDGKFNSKYYRKFKLTSLKLGEVNDYKALQEVLIRRTNYLDPEKNKNIPKNKVKKDKSFQKTPDLIIIDGGKGQLSSVSKILQNNFSQITLASIAKKEELIFIEGHKEPITITPNSSEHFFLQQIRDEAHRFAITFQKKQRQNTLSLKIDDVPGIGAKTKKKLMSKFSTSQEIFRASIEELGTIVGEKMAKKIKEGV